MSFSIITSSSYFSLIGESSCDYRFWMLMFPSWISKIFAFSLMQLTAQGTHLSLFLWLLWQWWLCSFSVCFVPFSFLELCSWLCCDSISSICEWLCPIRTLSTMRMIKYPTKNSRNGSGKYSLEHLSKSSACAGVTPSAVSLWICPISEAYSPMDASSPAKSLFSIYSLRVATGSSSSS